VNSKSLRVGIAELKTAGNPKILTTPALGSCVAVVLYEVDLKMGGMAHVMLPDSNKSRKKQNAAKFADTAIRQMIRALERKGASKERLVAKIVGGAHMFNGNNGLVRDIGMRNVEAAKNILKQEGIRIISEDTGADYGRSVEFHTCDGKVFIRSVKGKKGI